MPPLIWMICILGGSLSALVVGLIRYDRRMDRESRLEETHRGRTVTDVLRGMGYVIDTGDAELVMGGYLPGTLRIVPWDSGWYCPNCDTTSACVVLSEAIEVKLPSIIKPFRVQWDVIGKFCNFCGHQHQISGDMGFLAGKLSDGDNLLDVLAAMGGEGPFSVSEERDRRLAGIEREAQKRLTGIREERSKIQARLLGESCGNPFRTPQQLTAVPSDPK